MVTALIDQHVARWLRAPFVVGRDDCAFAVRALLAEAGATTIYENRVGEFGTAEAIEQFIAEETGGRGLVALILQIARQHGWPRIHPGEAVDGDIVILRGPDGAPVVGVARGRHVLTRANPGVVSLPLLCASVAFRVPHGV